MASSKIEIAADFGPDPSTDKPSKAPTKQAAQGQKNNSMTQGQVSFSKLDPKLSTILEVDMDHQPGDPQALEQPVWEPAKPITKREDVGQKKSAAFFQPLEGKEVPKTEISSSTITGKLSRIPSVLDQSQMKIYNTKTNKLSLLPVQVQKVNRDKYMSFGDKAARWEVSCAVIGLLGLVCQVFEVG